MLEIFLVFLRIGLVGFGGPIALVALIEREICHNKKWLSVESFTEIFAVCKLLPGPLAVQVAICCGFQRGRRLGGFLAGVGFLLPALIMIIILGSLYTHNLNTSSPLVKDVFRFMQDATLAIILCTLWDLISLYVKNITAWVIVSVCTLLIYLHPGIEPLAIIAFGVGGLLCYSTLGKDLSKFPAIFVASLPVAVSIPKSEVFYSKLLHLLWICIKAGEFSFGTGLAIIPLLHADLVTSMHWLNDKQFLDGITLGQITPGPTTISIVFFGFVVAGIPGLLVSLVGFYIPPMFNALVLIPLFWKKLTSSPYLKIFTMWAFPAVIGGIASATLKLGISAIRDFLDVALILIVLFIVRKKLIPIWALIPICGLLGVISALI